MVHRQGKRSVIISVSLPLTDRPPSDSGTLSQLSHHYISTLNDNGSEPTEAPPNYDTVIPP